MKINRTVFRAVEILELLTKNMDGLSTSEIADIMKIPKTSVFDIIQTLLFMQVLELKDEKFKKYKIGVKAFEIGNKYTKDIEVLNVADQYLKDLSHKLNKTVFIAVENNLEVVYLKKYEPEKAIITTAGIGSKNPMYCTSLGKAMLSAYSDDILKEKVSKLNLVRYTENTLTSKEKLLQNLEEVRRRGYSIDNRELEDHMFCMGAPLRNYENDVVGAISITGLYREDEVIDNQGELVKETALKISRKLGFSGDDLYNKNLLA